MKLLLSTLLYLFFVNTALAQDSTYKSLNLTTKTFEILQGFEYTRDGITIIVLSNGCTEKESFRVEHDQVGDFVNIPFYRVEKDIC